jgi:Domain of unknown function (DUF3330)
MSAKTNIKEKPTPTEPNSVACCVCMAEIPESVAMSSEADEYTQHFCGIECYNKWHDKAEKAQTGS